ncbi:hypothetical protein CV681_05995 [Borreliella burgdorferi]|uniref:hypothetical protein n=2 Tax=Borreliella burgdorferi TaxID=139 RepID=UPI000D02CF7D|nr:hypothetical protein [Borreliella burgdorferi]PRQ97394.1 hypothetical protein CV681_05995 [Borreliella burgdorferi]
MKRKSNICISLLVTILFVSCKFFGNKSASKEKEETSFSDTASKISKSGTAASSDKQEKNTSDVTGDAKKHTSSPYMLADALIVSDTTNRDRDKQENKDKLNEEDKKKLNAFFSTTKTYQSSLDSIYNKYTGYYNTIDTYGSCDTYRIECFSVGPSEKRKQALADLEKLKLDEKYTQLSTMLKSAVPSYYKKNLDDSIAQYKEAIKQAIEAESKIETVKDYATAQSAADDKKKRNIDNLKIVRDVLLIIKKTIEKASRSYADAFAIATSSLSCSEFKQAVKEFNDAAKQYANGNKGDNAVNVIVGTISSMTYVKFKDEFARAKMFARNYRGDEVDKMIRAINKLCDVYKKKVAL